MALQLQQCDRFPHGVARNIYLSDFSFRRSGYDTKFHTQNDSANGMKTPRQILQIQQCDQNTV